MCHDYFNIEGGRVLSNPTTGPLGQRTNVWLFSLTGAVTYVCPSRPNTVLYQSTEVPEPCWYYEIRAAQLHKQTDKQTSSPGCRALARCCWRRTPS